MIVTGANLNFDSDSGQYINMMDAGMIKAWSDRDRPGYRVRSFAMTKHLQRSTMAANYWQSQQGFKTNKKPETIACAEWMVSARFCTTRNNRAL
jgi:hypothetical protein